MNKTRFASFSDTTFRGTQVPINCVLSVAYHLRYRNNTAYYHMARCARSVVCRLIGIRHITTYSPFSLSGSWVLAYSNTVAFGDADNLGATILAIVGGIAPLIS